MNAGVGITSCGNLRNLMGIVLSCIVFGTLVGFRGNLVPTKGTRQRDYILVPSRVPDCQSPFLGYFWLITHNYNLKTERLPDYQTSWVFGFPWYNLALCISTSKWLLRNWFAFFKWCKHTINYFADFIPRKKVSFWMPWIFGTIKLALLLGTPSM